MKSIRYRTRGQRADIGHLRIYRLLSNPQSRAIGPFVFLDHIAPNDRPAAMRNGTGAHPHRGIATLTYILEGEGEHFDSAGHHARVHSGGVQWMKAGNGVVHDETLNADSRSGSERTHAFQFWINLPARHKAEPPEYLSVQSEEVPVVDLHDAAGRLRVIVGGYGEKHSRIPDYSPQFLYHLELVPGRRASIELQEGLEVAAFVPEGEVSINKEVIEAGTFVAFDTEAGTVECQNEMETSVNMLLFGGEPYREPFVAEGPFVMNSVAELATAYRDYQAGKYGTINYTHRSARP